MSICDWLSQPCLSLIGYPIPVRKVDTMGDRTGRSGRRNTSALAERPICQAGVAISSRLSRKAYPYVYATCMTFSGRQTDCTFYTSLLVTSTLSMIAYALEMTRASHRMLRVCCLLVHTTHTSVQHAWIFAVAFLRQLVFLSHDV